MSAAAGTARTARGGESGFLIIAVLWILLSLATLASVYAFYAGASAVGARVSNDRAQAEALVTAAYELAALRLLSRSESDPRAFGAFAAMVGGVDLRVDFLTEGARIDLNAAPRQLLAGLFLTLGAKPDHAGAYADRIIGWRKPNAAGEGKDGEASESGTKEADLYKEAGVDYAPRQAPFQNVAELRFVHGLPHDLVERAMPFVTIFNGSPQIDVAAAPAEVVRALPNLPPDVAAFILEKRGSLDAKSLLARLGRAKANVSLEPRKATRVAVGFTLPTGRRVNAEAVLLLLDKDTKPYRILSWRDDFDGSLAAR